MTKISKSLSGISGEYFVAAELSRLGFMASILLRNNESIDILAKKGLKTFSIQVKTIQTKTRKWPMNKKAEHIIEENLFYVFVHLKPETKHPDFYVVPSNELANNIKINHQTWKNSIGKNGQTHNETDIRSFKDDVDKYFEKWDLLK